MGKSSSSSTDLNKILQWYCCQCGNCHGLLTLRPLLLLVRLTCQRCRHMMCPYCVKGRVKDVVKLRR